MGFTLNQHYWEKTSLRLIQSNQPPLIQSPSRRWDELQTNSASLKTPAKSQPQKENYSMLRTWCVTSKKKGYLMKTWCWEELSQCDPSTSSDKSHRAAVRGDKLSRCTGLSWIQAASGKVLWRKRSSTPHIIAHKYSRERWCPRDANFEVKKRRKSTRSSCHSLLCHFWGLKGHWKSLAIALLGVDSELKLYCHSWDSKKKRNLKKKKNGNKA